MLSRIIIAFPPRSKHLLISWPQSPSVVILEPKTVACCRVRNTKYNYVCTSPFEGGPHHLHYPYHSLASGQTRGREHSPTHQQKIGLKIYWAWPYSSEQDPVSPTVSLSHQEASISLLSLSIERRQNETTITETNQTDHMDHSLV